MKKKLLLIFLFFTFFLQTAFAQINTVDFNGLSENQYLAQSYSTGGFTFSINLVNGGGIVTRSGSGFQGSISLYDTNTNIGALTRWTIKKNDGSEFQFRSIFLQDAGFASPSGTIQGFKNGSAVGPAKSINFNSSTAGLKDFAGDADFYDVDEIRIQAVDINFHLDHFTYGPVFVDETEIPAEITSISLTGAPLSNVSSVTFAVNFSKAALNVSSDDFDLNRTGTANGSIGSVSGSGSSYTVTVNNIIGEGSLRLDLKEGTDISNSNGNNGTAGFTSGQTHYVSPCLIETLEDETNGSKAFSIGSNNFSITGNMEVRTETPTIGIDGSRYTLINTGTGTYTISSNNGVVLLNRLAIYLSSLTDGTNPTGNGTLTLVGKQGGSTVYTITKNSGFETDGTTNSGYTILDFSTEGGVDNSIIPVDQLEISIGGGFQYLNVDNFGFCTDDEAPNAYSVNIDQDPIADATENDVSFTFTDAELNATYNYTFTSSGGGTPISGSGTISSVNQQVKGIDLGSLNVGMVTLSVTLTDLSGNVGNPATDNKSKVSNSPPVATPPAAPVVQEDDVDVPIADAFAVADVDGDDQTVSFTVTGGTLSLGTTGITFGGDGNGSTSFTASGSLSNINAALTAATFTPNPDLNGTNAGTISFLSNDTEVDSNVASVSFDIEAINDDPKLTGLPNSIAVEEDASDDPFDISSATISDVDAGSGEVTLKLSATGGIFDIAAGTGITVSGHLTGELTLTGNLTNLTNYISQPTNIYFRPDANLIGDASASVEVRINDNGNIGLGGGNDILIATIEIDIIPVNDPPTAINFTVNPLEGQVYIFSAANFGYKDVDGQPLVDLKIESIPAEGILYVDADGDNSYDEGEEVSASERISKNVLDAGNLQYIQNGTINTSFQFEVSDGTLSSGEDYLAKLEILALPTVTSVIVPANDRYVEGENLDFTVNFSSDVVVNTAGGMPELSLTVGASARAAVYLSGSGSSSLVFRYTVQNGEEDQDGIAIGDLTTNDGTMESPDGTAADLNLRNVGTTSGVMVDAVIPVVSSVNTPSVGTFKGGQNLDFTVNFAEVVDVKTDTGIPSIVLIIGEENVSADYMSGSGSSAIVFRYTIAPGDLDLDGIQVGALATNGGSIQDAAGNNANLLLNSMGTTDGILVDATAPAVASVSTPVNGTYTSGQNLDFTINFNEKVTINTTGGAPQLAIAIGSQTRQADYLSGSGTSAIVFRYTVQNWDLDTDGISVGKLNSNGSTIVDDSGNDAILTLNAVGSTALLFVDAIEPTGYSVNIDQDIINGVNDEEVSFTLSGAELGTTFNYSFSSEAGSTIISGSGTVSLSNQRITGIDLSSLPDGELTLELTLKDAAGNVGLNASDIVTKDLSARLSIIALTQAEEDDIDGGFEVTTDNLFASNTTVNIAITGTATQGTDYGNIGTSFIFPANTKSVRIPLDVLDDLDVEGNETVIISLVETDNLQVSIGTSEKAMITITDNDVPSELVITPTLNQSKVYGESDPVFTYTATGFNLGDDESLISGKLTRITGETVGTYALKKGSLDAGANYFISIVPVNFTITPATLRVSADANDQKIYGENDPTLTYSAIGFKNGDNENILTGELSRMPGENVGTYPISLGTLNAGTNYTITYIGSDFEIKQRELAVMADPNQSKIFGNADPTFTYQVSNFGNGDDESILTGVLSRQVGEAVGRYPINQGTLSAGVNYKIDYTGSDFTISEKTLTITVTEDQNKVYGEADPILTYTATGFENGDDQSILSGDLLREAGENVGTYPINLGTLSAGGNYTISFIGTGFQINPATLTVSASAGQNKVYGEEDLNLSYTVSGFRFTEGPSILSGELEREAGENVGTYPINLGSLVVTDNYIIDYFGADFEITTRTLTVVADPNQSKIFGNADPTFTYQVSNFGNGDDESILTGALSRLAGETVGSYPINLGDLSAGVNYKIDYTGSDFTISEKTLTITVTEDQNKVYGEADPILTYTATGFENGDDQSILSGDLLREAGENVGTYPINLGTLSAGGNYTISFIGTGFQINPATLTVSASAGQNKVYGEEDLNLSYTVSGFRFTEGPSILSGELEREAGENVGTYPINLGSLVVTDNYIIDYFGADFEITTRTLTVVADPNQSKIFGDADPTFTYQVSNFGNGDDESILTGALSRLSGETVGSYPINVGDLSAGVNYNIDYTGSDFTISEKTLTIKVTEDQNKVYGEADPVLAYTATGFENGDDQSILSGDLLREAGEDVGTYSINLGTLSAGGNYTISFIGTGFQIIPATLTVSASAGQNKVYGMEDPKPSYTASGFQFSEGPSILTGELQRQAGENVGTYAINQGSLSAGDNYIIDYLGADFEINPAPLTVTASADQNKVYGEEDPNLSYTVSGFQFSNGPSILSGELEREAGENVGTYPINLGSLVATDNYIIDYFGADFEIKARTLTVIADQDQSKVYGATDPVLTYNASNFGNGDDESILTGALSRLSGETVGSYPINLGDLSAGVNYAIEYTGSDFKISEKILTITVTQAQSKIYGQDDPVLTYTATGLDNGDDVSILTGELQRALGENVGTYPINLGTLGAGDNYTINFEVADFTITPASLNVTPEINQSKIYGEADGVISYTATGFERGDNETILSGALTRTAGENVGSYMITQGTLDAGLNYRLNYSGTDFTITPRSLTVIADSNQVKVYGENDPVLTYSATNFGNGDDESILNGSLSREEGEHVGKYAIKLGTLDAGRNYTIDYKGTEFSILKKTLSITVDDNQSKVYGDADPVFSYTVSGFENGDSFSVLSGTLDREPGEDIGTYAIGKGSLNAGNNYSISFNSSDFEITKASLQIIANVGQSKIYGESDPLFTYIASGFKRGDDQNVLTGILSRAEGENVGSYAIQLGSLNATKNYMIDFEGTTFEIKPATIDGIIFEDANFIYDGTPKSLEIQGEIPSGTKVLYTNNERINVGRQEVTTTITGPNYIPLILKADITITPASITEVTFGDATYTYDGSQHSIFVDHLPEEAKVTYVNNGQIQAGIYKVVAKISQENYNDLELAANLLIEKAQALITTDAQQSFTYDGELKLVKAQLNHSETELIYSPQQGYSEVGTFNVTVSSKETNNYLAASKEVTLSIEYSEIEGVVFENESFVYDGSTKSITVSGLPQGASVTYDNNGKTNAGNYTVVATISSANSLDKVLSAQLVITRAPQEIRFDALENRYQRDGYFQLDALSSSGLPVVYSYSYEAEVPAATVGPRGFVRILGPGTITITAKQQGNQNYEAADPVVRTLTIIGNDAKLNGVSINGRTYSNPQEEIYYLIDCEDNVSQIQIQFEPNQGATLDQEANLTMTIPSPGIYQKTVTVTSEDGTSTKTYTIIIEKNFNFRDIVIQKFNNVLLVNNNSETNGGYSFVSYRWYRNGSVVSNGQYYSVGDDINDALDPESNYYVVVETQEGEVLRTCVSNVQLRSSLQVTLAPNPVRSGGTMELFVDFPKEELETMEISIHNLNGMLLKTLKSKSEFTNISLPNNLQIGIYLLRIDTQNIHKTLKFIVK